MVTVYFVQLVVSHFQKREELKVCLERLVSKELRLVNCLLLQWSGSESIIGKKRLLI